MAVAKVKQLNGFKVGAIVKGVKAGTFKIKDFKVVGHEMMVILKPYNPEIQAEGKGQLALGFNDILPL